MKSDITLPNLITVARLVLVPVVVYLISDREFALAFWVFVVAGVSDAVDGFIARHWNLRSDLGAYLDPLADKALLVSIYVTLAIEAVLPRWLVILVVSRDVLILGAFLLSWIMGRPVAVKPLFVSKANTTAQLLLGAIVLADSGFAMDLHRLWQPGVFVVATLTVVSGAAYLVGWLPAMSGALPGSPGAKPPTDHGPGGAGP